MAILQLHLPMSLTQEGFRKGQLLSARLILTLLQRGLSIAARMFVIYMLLCVHMEMQGLLYLKNSRVRMPITMSSFIILKMLIIMLSMIYAHFLASFMCAAWS